jgi:hypothetical protein
MPLLRTRFAVRVGGLPRMQFSILEKQNGELLVPSRTAERAESNLGPRILEQRYSIHPSPQSAEFTTIKQTINTEDGKTETSAILTDAVKLKTGFAVVFVRRVQDLTPERYALRDTKKKHERTVFLADLDPKQHTMFFGLFVGHPDTPFEALPNDVVVSHFPFKKFKIIILATAKLMPVHYTTDYSHAITLAPEMVHDAQSKAVFRYQMQGKSAAICLRQFHNSVTMLEKMLWEKALLEPGLTEPHIVEFIKDRINELSYVTTTSLELGTGQQSIRMLGDGKPPSHQSKPRPPEFFRRRGRWED